MESGDRFRGRRTPEAALVADLTELIPELQPGTKVERVDALTLAVTFADGTTTRWLLTNLLGEVSGLEDDERARRLRFAVRTMRNRDRPTTWEATAPKLMPAIRAVSGAAAAGPLAARVVRQTFAPFLVSITAVDDEHAMSYVMESDLEAWGVDAETVEATARANLREHALLVDGNAPRLEIAGPDGYASSWLAVPETIEQVGSRLGGEFVALARSRDSLRLVATRDRDFLERELEEALEEYPRTPRALSPVPYAIVDGHVVEWDPPADDPCRPSVERARRVLALVQYTTQRKALLAQPVAEAASIATYNLMQRRHGTVYSWAAWGNGVEATLLPRTDSLKLADAETQRAFTVSWADVERLVGDLIRPEPGYDPQRWRVGAWPDEFRLAQLRAVAPDGD